MFHSRKSDSRGKNEALEDMDNGQFKKTIS
jgi:hypothetical protein